MYNSFWKDLMQPKRRGEGEGNSTKRHWIYPTDNSFASQHWLILSHCKIQQTLESKASNLLKLLPTITHPQKPSKTPPQILVPPTPFPYPCPTNTRLSCAKIDPNAFVQLKNAIFPRECHNKGHNELANSH